MITLAPGSPRIRVAIDDGGLSVHGARVELVDAGWRLAGPRLVTTTYPASATGLGAAAADLARALGPDPGGRPGARRGAGGDGTDLFTQLAVEIPTSSGSSTTSPQQALRRTLGRALYLAWCRRAARLRPDSAPLLAGRRLGQVLAVVGAPAFLRAPWLLEDARRWRAARAVLVDVPGLAPVPSPLALDAVVDAARRWRSWLSVDRAAPPTRALHASIEFLEHPSLQERAVPAGALDPAQADPLARDGAGVDVDVIDAEMDEAIRALRFVPLVRPLRSVPHLLLLTEIARAASPTQRAALRDRLACVQHTDDDELADVLARAAAVLRLPVGSGALLHAVGVLLARDVTVPRQGGLRAVVTRSLEALHPRRRRAAPARRPRDVADTRRALAVPPVPLPTTTGVRFLATVDDLIAEGAAMHHCIATCASAGLAGHAFYFHVDHAGARASVEVDRQGRVVQSKGPANADNAAARWGRDVLGRWARGLVLVDVLRRHAGDDTAVPDDDDALAAAGGPPLRPGDVALRTVGELRAALVDVEIGADTVRPFLERVLPLARGGLLWLVSRSPPPGRTPAGRALVGLDAIGALAFDATVPRRRAAAHVPAADPTPPPGRSHAAAGRRRLGTVRFGGLDQRNGPPL
jgi:hypothetical protein